MEMVERKGIEGSDGFEKKVIEGLMREWMKFEWCVISDGRCR